jgi:6-phosphogluconolactonase (cycloisomerase 2 family)
MRTFVTTIAIVLLLCGLAVAQDKPDEQLAKKLDELILRLDSDSFDIREKAEKELTELGDKAREAVTRATRSTSAEVRQRAVRILRALKQGTVDLKHLESLRHHDMLGICGIEASPDGKFLYAASWQASSVVVFRRDAATGKLEHVQSLVDPANIKGITCLRISSDGKLAAGVSFGAKTVTLFTRDPDKGTLTLAHAVGPDLAAGTSLQWPINCAFSPDARFVYAVDDRLGAIIVLEVVDGKRLKWVQASTGKDGCLEGTRTIAMHPGGKLLVTGGTRAGTLCLFDIDGVTGRVEVRQVLTDGQDMVQGLAGIHGVNISPDGKHVYTVSGRFQGDQAVGAFRLEEGKLTLIKEFISDQGDLVNFQGGNKAALSPDGLTYYACGTTSQSLACFRRDPDTGELTFVTTIHDEATGRGSELGPANLACSPDGRFAYVTLESTASISIFERTTKK